MHKSCRNYIGRLYVDPETSALLATDENVVFSRYITSLDEHPVKLKQKGSLRGLVAVASPAGLPPIAIEEELERARKGLVDIALTFLPENERRATLENILDGLRIEPMVDVLYVVCHGMIKKGQPYIFLENELGEEHRVCGGDLAMRIQQMQNRPRLVILVSCQSAGAGTGDALSALGPHLADIGVPAVVAMQDNISMETADAIPAYFLPRATPRRADRPRHGSGTRNSQ